MIFGTVAEHIGGCGLERVFNVTKTHKNMIQVKTVIKNYLLMK